MNQKEKVRGAIIAIEEASDALEASQVALEKAGVLVETKRRQLAEAKAEAARIIKAAGKLNVIYKNKIHKAVFPKCEGEQPTIETDACKNTMVLD